MARVPFGVPVSPGDLLGRLVDRVIEATGLPRDLVFESIAADEDHLLMPPGDRFVTAAGLDYPLADGVPGGGRYLTGFDSTHRVAVFTRVGTDQDLRARDLLRDRTRGLLTLALRLIDGLQLWPCYVDTADPPDPTLGSYLREPARLRPGGLRVMRKPGRSGQVWAVAETTWQLNFTAALTNDPLPP